MDCPREPSATVKAIVAMLDELRSWIAEIPPAQQPSRFGNISFRVWQVRLAERSAALQSQFLPDTMNTMVLPYFTADPFAPSSASAVSSSSTAAASSSSSSASCPASTSHEPGVSATSSAEKPKEQQDELAALAALTAKLDKVTSQISSTAPMLSKPPVPGAAASSSASKPATVIRPRPLVPMTFTKEQAIRQLTPYLLASFGDKQRIDYGTGHELNFVAWLYCLTRLGVLCKEDSISIVFDIFMSYLKLMRELQRVYWLEPAGSRGVWGLDDYQFLPFLWGAGQLIGHPTLKTHQVVDPKLVAEQADAYLYMNCIQFVNQMKSGRFEEHSPILYDISGVEKWEKINSGMIKMYQAEVLNKFPVIQHFLFGALLSIHTSPTFAPAPVTVSATASFLLSPFEISSTYPPVALSPAPIPSAATAGSAPSSASPPIPGLPPSSSSPFPPCSASMPAAAAHDSPAPPSVASSSSS